MTIRTRAIIVLAGLLLCPLAAVTVTVALLFRDYVGFRQRTTMPIGPGTARMIQVGMTKRAVHTLLGRPPGDYASERVAVTDVATTLGTSVRTERWIGNDHAIYVIFDDAGRVKEVACYEAVAVPKLRAKGSE